MASPPPSSTNSAPARRWRRSSAGACGWRAPAGRWKGCCPFHGEKTPSFYVYEDGHYHCFGCGAHGDAIGFVMQSEGAGFMEAVERLAAEAGPRGAEALAGGRRGRAAAARPRRGAGGGPGQLPPAAVPAGGPPRAGLSARPRPVRADDPPLRPRLVGRGPRRAGWRTLGATGSPRTSSSTPD